MIGISPGIALIAARNPRAIRSDSENQPLFVESVCFCLMNSHCFRKAFQKWGVSLPKRWCMRRRAFRPSACVHHVFCRFVEGRMPCRGHKSAVLGIPSEFEGVVYEVSGDFFCARVFWYSQGLCGFQEKVGGLDVVPAGVVIRDGPPVRREEEIEASGIYVDLVPNDFEDFVETFADGVSLLRLCRAQQRLPAGGCEFMDL